MSLISKWSKLREKFRLKKAAAKPRKNHDHQMKLAVVKKDGRIVEYDASIVTIGGRMLTLCKEATVDDIRVGIRCGCMPVGVYVRTSHLEDDEFQLDKATTKGAVN